MRIFIMGSSGAGKTHLAKALAARLRLPHLELDSLRHQANWQQLPDAEFRELVNDFSSAEAWVVDGNYAVVREVLLSRATDVILLDYPKRIVMWRLLSRSITRVMFRRTLWNGNRERLSYLLSADPELNVLLWSWSNFDRRRSEFDQLESSSFKIHRLTHPREIRQLLKLF